MEISNERLKQEYQHIEDDIDVMKKEYREVQQLKEEERQIQSKLRRQQEELLSMYRNSDSFRLFTSLSEEINAEGKNIIQDLENRESEIKRTIKQYEDKLERIGKNIVRIAYKNKTVIWDETIIFFVILIIYAFYNSNSIPCKVFHRINKNIHTNDYYIKKENSFGAEKELLLLRLS